MVQRKVENKLGTKLESKNSVRSEKRSALRPSQFQEELKKKMKKVRSMKKVPDLDKFGKEENSKFDKPGVDRSGSDSPQKKMFPAKISNGSPNYMKPTSSSDARKERLQVSTHSQITDRNISNFSKNSRHGNRGSSQPKSLADSALKPVKSLAKTSSFKSVRSSMKASRVPLYPLNRSTCSSTLKDSKFPASIVLNPGGTESEGTSAVKVCPYTYCSLNGHHHPPLPPLKCFLSARRHLLKTQKKSKEFSPCKVKKPAEIDTGQVSLTRDSSISEADTGGMAMSSLVEEDFFVEIYASPIPGIAKAENSEGGYDESKLNLVLQTIDMESDPKAYDELLDVKDDEIECEPEKKEDCREIEEEESYSKISLDDDLQEQSNDFLAAEMDVFMAFSEYYECCPEDQDLADERNHKQADQAEKVHEIRIGSDLDEDLESIADIQLEETIHEASDMDWEEPEAQYSDNETDEYIFSDVDSETVSLPDEPIFEPDYLADTLTDAPEDTNILKDECEEDIISSKGKDSETVSLPDESIFEPDNLADTFTEAPEDTEILQDEGEEDIKSTEGKDSDLDGGDCIFEIDASSKRSEVSEIHEGQSQNQMSEALDVDHIQVEIESPSPSDKQEIEENLSNSSDNASEEFAQIGEEKDGNPEPEKDEELGNYGASIIQECYSLRDDQETEDGQLKPVTDGLQDGSVLEGSDQSQDQAIVETDLDEGMETNKQFNDDGDLVDNQICDSHQGVSKIDQNISEDQNPDMIQKEIEVKGGQEVTCDDDPDESKLDAAANCLEGDNKNPSEDGMILNQPEGKICNNLNKAKNIKRKAVITDQNADRKFNPREPRYLEIEPDPDAEKVDLKHQMMDERKNAEEWMLDYALRQAVTKLAPARNRRVSLLVEAFETVIPPPKYENHLRHSTGSFTHARPIQACS